MLEVSNINDEPHDEYRGNTCMISILGFWGPIFFVGLQQTFYLDGIHNDFEALQCNSNLSPFDILQLLK